MNVNESNRPAELLAQVMAPGSADTGKLFQLMMQVNQAASRLAELNSAVLGQAGPAREPQLTFSQWRELEALYASAPDGEAGVPFFVGGPGMFDQPAVQPAWWKGDGASDCCPPKEAAPGIAEVSTPELAQWMELRTLSLLNAQMQMNQMSFLPPVPEDDPEDPDNASSL